MGNTFVYLYVVQNKCKSNNYGFFEQQTGVFFVHALLSRANSVIRFAQENHLGSQVTIVGGERENVHMNISWKT